MWPGGRAPPASSRHRVGCSTKRNDDGSLRGPEPDRGARYGLQGVGHAWPPPTLTGRGPARGRGHRCPPLDGAAEALSPHCCMPTPRFSLSVGWVQRWVHAESSRCPVEISGLGPTQRTTFMMRIQRHRTDQASEARIFSTPPGVPSWPPISHEHRPSTKADIQLRPDKFAHQRHACSCEAPAAPEDYRHRRGPLRAHPGPHYVRPPGCPSPGPIRRGANARYPNLTPPSDQAGGQGLRCDVLLQEPLTGRPDAPKRPDGVPLGCVLAQHSLMLAPHCIKTWVRNMTTLETSAAGGMSDNPTHRHQPQARPHQAWAATGPPPVTRVDNRLPVEASHQAFVPAPDLAISGQTRSGPIGLTPGWNHHGRDSPIQPSPHEGGKSHSLDVRGPASARSWTPLAVMRRERVMDLPGFVGGWTGPQVLRWRSTAPEGVDRHRFGACRPGRLTASLVEAEARGKVCADLVVEPEFGLSVIAERPKSEVSQRLDDEQPPTDAAQTNHPSTRPNQMEH